MVKQVKDVIAEVEADGWYLVKLTRGSHRQYKHPSKKGRVTIPGHLNDDLHRGTLASIYRQAQLEQW
jgi:predicted RNA binding protein YcfA (HicA-like mRNA interferase family)